MSFIVLHKNLIIMYCVLALFIAAIFFVRLPENVPVASQPKEIPIYCVDRDDNMISVTFDVAWDDKDTSEILSILDKYNVKATFFVVGEWADKYPDSIKAMAAAGHEVANHADTHPHMTKLSKDKMVAEILDCDAKIFKLTGTSHSLFRAPYGEYNDTVVQAAKSANHYMIQWDVDSLDWKDLSPNEITDRVASRTVSGSIILLHVGSKNTPAALPMILEKLQQGGFTMIPVSKLIYKDNYTLDHAGKQILN